MRRFTRSMLVVLGLAASSWSCSNTTPTTVTPNPNPVSEQFSGTLTVNGAQIFTFHASTPGTITVTLTTLSPDTTTQVGLSLGTWNGAACQAIIANDKAVQGTTVTGTATASATLCARAYDVGNLSQSESVVVTVIHP